MKSRKMTINTSTFMVDIFSFIKTDLLANVTDPLTGTRSSDSKFIMTSYPKRKVQYPLITLRMVDVNAYRAGMQTTNMDVPIKMEVRIWGRSVVERDGLFEDVFNRLKNIQFTTSTGSADNGLHDFNLLNTVEINEDGEDAPKSKIMQVAYKCYL